MAVRVLTFVMLAVFGLSSSASAWEEDVHYGLSRWLALQAGFTDAAAERIAQRNVEADEGILDARHLVFWYACLSRDRNASELVKDLHFPGGGDLPSPPEKRSVEPGGPYALRSIRGEITRTLTTDQDRQDSLARFGKGLHALQDSWSHQGEPSVPWLCHKELAWGHPAKRGGWSSHRADVTLAWPGDTLGMAQATWDVFGAYARAHPWATLRAPRDWPGLVPEVQGFAAARTKTEKATWFRARSFRDVSFLRKISLPDGEEPLAQAFLGFPYPRSTGGVTHLAAVPADAATFLQDFWRRWVGSRDYGATAAQYVAAAPLVGAFSAQGFKMQGNEQVIARTVLAMWRVADHGRVARVGHVPPVPGTPAESEIQKLVADPGVFLLSDGLNDAMAPLGKGGPPLALAPAGKDRYAAFGRFRHAPHDVVMAIAERVTGQWRVTEIVSVVEH